MASVDVFTKLVQHKGNEFAYFSITANYRNDRGRIESTGCLHEEIEEIHPGMYTDFIQMHLSDVNGVPMHSVANGYYYLQVARGDIKGDYTFDTVADHLRVSRLCAVQIKDYTAEQFASFVEAQKPRWKEEANAMIEKYNLVVELT